MKEAKGLLVPGPEKGEDTQLHANVLGLLREKKVRQIARPRKEGWRVQQLLHLNTPKHAVIR
jgi:hypothetical protein